MFASQSAATRWIITSTALIGFAGAHGDAFELQERAETSLDPRDAKIVIAPPQCGSRANLAI